MHLALHLAILWLLFAVLVGATDLYKVLERQSKACTNWF
jgi:DnaJ-related protein SCJ1